MTERSPYDSVLMVGFGGPTEPGHSEEFVRRVAGNRPGGQARIVEVAKHYDDLGGISPYNEKTLAQARALEERKMKKVPLSVVKDDLSKYLRMAEKNEVVITRHDKPAGVLIGFESDEDWFEYRLENDPRFLERVQSARKNLRSGRGVRLENIKVERD